MSRIANEARSNLPSDIRQLSGRAFYSPASTLFSDSPIYFLGMYPGYVRGDPQPHNNWTIEQDLERLESGRIFEHAYLEEKWGKDDPGHGKLQKRALHLFGVITGADSAGRELLLKTPASNMILVRNSQNNEALLRSSKTLVEHCWHFHQAVIDVKKPKVILVHGVRFAKELAQVRRLGNCSCWPSGFGAQPHLYSWKLEKNRTLLAIPNLGRYDPQGPREEALRKFFREAVPQGFNGQLWDGNCSI